jgi:IS30 family transposase
MPRGKELTEYEKGQIDARRELGQGYGMIAKALGRSKSGIQHHANGDYGQKKRPGRPKKLTKQDERKIVKKASNSTKSLATIKSELNLDVSKSTVWRVLDKNPNIVHAKMAKAPNLTSDHKIRRLEFAKQNMATEWKKVMVSFVLTVECFSFFRSSSVMRRNSIWTARMASIRTGMTCVKSP